MATLLVPLLGSYPREMKVHFHREALFITEKNWKQFKYLSTDEWISSLWHIHIREYYSTLKRTADKCNKLDASQKHSKRRSTRRRICCMIPFV